MARNSTKPQAIVKDFAALTALMSQPRQVSQVGEVKKSLWFDFSADDDVTDVIWRLMSDGKGRTVSDITVILKDVPQFDARDIEQALAFFHLQGCMLKTKQHIPIYTLKGNAMQPQASKTKVKEAVKKDAQDMGMAQEPTLIEKIDIALWELMHDGRWRTVNEMCRSILNGPITRQNSRTRLESHYRGTWFERRGDGDNTKYRLRGSIAYPHPKSLGAHKTPEVEQIALFDQKDVMTPTPVIDNVVPLAPKAPVTVSASVRPQAIQVRANDPTMEDGLSTSIWKVMADRNEYTAHELAALLEHVGIPYSAIANRLSALFLHSKWFNRQHVGEGRLRCFAYRLNADIQCPVDETTYVSPARKEMIRKGNLQAKADARVGVREHLKPVDNTPPAVAVALERAGISAKPGEERPTLLGPATKAAIANVVNKEIEIPAPASNDAAPMDASLSKPAINTAISKLNDLLVSANPPIGATGSATSHMVEAARKFGEMHAMAGVNKLTSSTVKQQVATQAQQVNPAPQPKEEKHMTNAESNVAYIGPIVQIKVDIKGIPFTLIEAEQLMPEIVRLGYSSPAGIKDNSSSLIQTNISIKNHSFTPQELCDVYRGLTAAGLGKVNK